MGHPFGAWVEEVAIVIGLEKRELSPVEEQVLRKSGYREQQGGKDKQGNQAHADHHAAIHHHSTHHLGLLC